MKKYQTLLEDLLQEKTIIEILKHEMEQDDQFKDHILDIWLNK